MGAREVWNHHIAVDEEEVAVVVFGVIVVVVVLCYRGARFVRLATGRTAHLMYWYSCRKQGRYLGT